METAEAKIARMAEQFFGYGRWSAPFWFIGPEAGMARDGDDLLSRYEAWKSLEFQPVVDCATHHRGFGFTKWHQPHPPTQPTWRQLIRLLLAYQGKPNDTESIREYQRDLWGTDKGETCVIELSGLPSPNMRTPQERSKFLKARITRIQQELQKNAPDFVVLYGIGQKEHWEQLLNAKFDGNGMCHHGSTVAALALHPVTTGLRNEYWVALGDSIRERRRMVMVAGEF